MVSTTSKVIIESAFRRMRLLEMFYEDDIPWNAIEEGFECKGETILLANRARGIFKPKQMDSGLLSIKTTVPRKGRINIYDDAEKENGYFRYALQKGEPYKGGNKHLWEALDARSPFIYFHAVSAGRYKAIWPCYVVNIYPDKMYCEVVVGVSRYESKSSNDEFIYEVPDAPERKYAVRESRVRLFQATFRENVLNAYDNKCAVSGLPVPELLEAAHITPDSNLNSTTEISNGIALSRLHHRAYDGNLIGISPNYKVVVSEKLMSISDGMILEAMKSYNGCGLLLPKRKNAQPDKERLAERFEMFISSN
ncbi:MAG: HNH endonuclease [Gammaproteobacteria bacterium]|nr:HNH endonuclease [Gammaproteobacteria bacterium]MCW8839374.1 HNH endonuclease [Gammaproteobacteria bacterium]MCW8957800.1 HNH endonuclease [Gammaproteobacteria bacterium]MCW8973857.1 HNH endonuclease [Gammaproteobacteria bacterium]MCW8992741.1 HNH endonuclease [Gammaproteobacteria bacterium]